MNEQQLRLPLPNLASHVFSAERQLPDFYEVIGTQSKVSKKRSESPSLLLAERTPGGLDPDDLLAVSMVTFVRVVGRLSKEMKMVLLLFVVRRSWFGLFAGSDERKADDGGREAVAGRVDVKHLRLSDKTKSEELEDRVGLAQGSVISYWILSERKRKNERASLTSSKAIEPPMITRSSIASKQISGSHTS
jgi:hypothetical protein